MIYVSQSQNPLSNPIDHQFSVNTRANELIRKHRQHGATYEISFRDLSLLMLQEVFCPVYGEGSQLLADCIQIKAGERVLEVGTGSGALAILAARQGGTVVATDINPIAVNCAKGNVQRNDCQEKVTIYEGNLFEPIKQNQEEKFSLIIFNPPFMRGHPKSLLEVAMYDENYHTLSHFFAEFPNYLKEGGRVLIAFSTAGDMAYFQQLVQDSGLSAKLVKKVVDRLEFVVYEFRAK